MPFIWPTSLKNAKTNTNGNSIKGKLSPTPKRFKIKTNGKSTTLILADNNALNNSIRCF